MTPRFPRSDEALTVLATIVLAVALYAATAALAIWAADLDGQTRARAYRTPAPRAPLGVCRERWESECVR